MTSPGFMPEEPGEHHFQIAEKAQAWLAAAAGGNGLSPEQVRLDRHDTAVYQLPGTVTVTFLPDVQKQDMKGRNPRGEPHVSEKDVMDKIVKEGAGLAHDPAVKEIVTAALQGDKGRGWGLEDVKIPLQRAAAVYCTIANCDTCHGQAWTPCGACHGAGKRACLACRGAGTETRGGGAQGPCSACGGQAVAWCAACKGTGRDACPACDGAGQSTKIYTAGYAARLHFEPDFSEVPPEVRAAAESLGIRKLAAEEHAEIFLGPPEARGEQMAVPCHALFPVTRAEFQISGKSCPATVTGLRGRVTEMEPFIDALIRPGINALVRLSKGPMAAGALIAAACRYKILRGALADVSSHSKGGVYLRLKEAYPVILSDKYARAVVKYADLTLLSLGRGPRNIGLAAGSGAAAVLFYAWFVAGLREAALPGGGHALVAGDIAVWAAGWAACFFTIKIMAARALKKNLPHALRTEAKGLPHAGDQGVYALATTFAPWFILALYGRAGWLLALLARMGF